MGIFDINSIICHQGSLFDSIGTVISTVKITITLVRSVAFSQSDVILFQCGFFKRRKPDGDYMVTAKPGIDSKIYEWERCFNGSLSMVSGLRLTHLLWEMRELRGARMWENYSGNFLL